MLAALAVLAALLAGTAQAGERPAPEARDREARRAAWLGRSCAAPGCAEPRRATLAHGAAFACAVIAAARLAQRRETGV